MSYAVSRPTRTSLPLLRTRHQLRHPSLHHPPLSVVTTTCLLTEHSLHPAHLARLVRPGPRAVVSRGGVGTRVSSLLERPRRVLQLDAGVWRTLSPSLKRSVTQRLRLVFAILSQTLAEHIGLSYFLLSLQVVDGKNAGGDSSEMEQIADTLSSPKSKVGLPCLKCFHLFIQGLQSTDGLSDIAFTFLA